MKKILITGKNSYIGNAVAAYLEAAGQYQVDKISLQGETWQQADFSGYDTILHVAGKAHVDIAGMDEETRRLYYEVNGQLPARVAAKAKAAGVGQFIHLSSVIIYGNSAPVGRTKMITADTKPEPVNFYGDSKLQGEEGLKPLADDSFRIAVLRLPLVYGKGSKGNYPLLAKIAGITPVFPRMQGERSMIYVENLAELIRQLIDTGEGGWYFPQNEEYVNTARMVQLIGAAKGRRIRLWSILNPIVWLASKLPGRVGALADKAFGSMTIDRSLSAQQEYHYQKYSLEESIRRIHED